MGKRGGFVRVRISIQVRQPFASQTLAAWRLSVRPLLGTAKKSFSREGAKPLRGENVDQTSHGTYLRTVALSQGPKQKVGNGRGFGIQEKTERERSKAEKGGA